MDTAASSSVLGEGGKNEAATESSECKVPSLVLSRPEDQPGDVSDDKKNDIHDTTQDETTTETSNSEKRKVSVESPEFKVPSVALSKPKSHPEVTRDGKEDANSVQEVLSSSSNSDGEKGASEEISGFKVPSVALSRPKNQAKPDKREDLQTVGESEPPPPLPYNEPSWSSTPSSPHVLTVIKNGTIIQTIELVHKPYHVFGRLPSCDIQFEHPSISRYHAILQYRPQDKEDRDNDSNDHPRSESVLSSSVSANPKEEGFYVYDLGSTHGTFINKTKIQMRCYYRLRLGQMAKFGGSSRLFLLESSSADQGEVEAAAADEIQEIVRLKQGMEDRKAELAAQQLLAEKEREDMGVMWGIVTDDLPSSVGGEGEDYDIDEEKEAYYRDDPKKALKKFFDREGLEFEYETEEEGTSRDRVFTVRVRLPIDTASGEAVYAEASLKGKKKDAVVLCALNACRMLDAQDMLRHHVKSRKAKKKNWAENDYYDSDEDTFLDRTGLIERKRKNRMKKAGALADVGENYESLEAKMKEVLSEMASIGKRLAEDRQANEEREGVDSLDDFMSKVKGRLDRSKRQELTHQLHSLKNEKMRLTKLLKLARSTELPELRSPMSLPEEPGPTSKGSVSEPESPVLTRSEDPAATTTALVRQYSSDASDQVDEVSKPRHKRGPRRKKPRLMGPSSLPPTSAEIKEPSLDIRDDKGVKDEDSTNYSDWLPPDKQTGDGKTFLNEKFGY